MVINSFQQIQHPDSDFLTLIIAILCGVANLFLFCFYGKKTTDSYRNIADCLYDCNWHEMPIDQQKYIIMMIMNAQIPLHYHGSRIVIMDLETFVKVRNTFNRIFSVFNELYFTVHESCLHLLHDAHLLCYRLMLKISYIICLRHFLQWFLFFVNIDFNYIQTFVYKKKTQLLLSTRYVAYNNFTLHRQKDMHYN